MIPRLLKWAPVSACFAVTLIFCLLFYYRAPFHDHWDIVPLFAQLKDGTLTISDLFALHGNHWHASGYVVQLGLGDLTAMNHRAESVFSVLIAGFGFVALWRMLERSISTLNVASAPAVWGLFGLSAFFFFSLDQAGNWLWGWQIAVFINVAGALWTIERLTCGLPTLLNTGLAVISAAAAIYAFGTGWVLLPIGFILLLSFGAWRTYQGRACLAIWAVFTGLLLWHFSIALTASSAAYTSSAFPDLTDVSAILGLIHYAINFVASPIVRFARDISIPITLIGMAVLIWSGWSVWRVDRANAWAALAPFLSMAVFAFGSGLLTAFGRWESFGVKQAFVSRYITFGTFFWIAVFVIAALAIARSSHQTHRRMFGLLGLLLVLKIGNIPSVVQKSVRLSNDIQTAAEHLAEDYPNAAADQYNVLHSPLQTVDPHIDTLAAHRVSLFSNVQPEADKE